MTTYEIFVHDDRYSVPTLQLLTLPDEDAARQAADALLRGSANHRGVELWQGGEQLLALGACLEWWQSARAPERLRMASGG